MSSEVLGSYLCIQKNGIEPNTFPDESFYYYTLPDFDSSRSFVTTLGRLIDSNKFKVSVGSLLISKLNPRIRRVLVVGNDEKYRSVCSTEFVVLTPAEGVVIKYLYYYMQSDNVFRRLESEAIGTTNSHTRYKPDLLTTLQVDFPDCLVQAKVGEILQVVDQTIEKTEALIKKYQQIKAGLMHDLFTRGIGTDGKLRPPREQAPELYQKTPIGWIPIEWTAMPLKHGLSTAPKNGFSPKEVDTWQDLYVLGLGCLTQSGFKPIQLKMAPRSALSSGAKLNDGDFLISRSNTPNLVGLCGIYKDNGIDTIYPDLMIRLKLNQVLHAEYLERYLLSKATRQRISAIAVGTSGSMVKINSKTLSALKITYPPIREQMQIVGMMNPIETKISSLQAEQKKLLQQKQGLMHDLLTGKVEVSTDPTGTAPH